MSQTDFHSPALLDLLLSSDASVFSTMSFPPLGNSDYVVVSVSINFLSNEMSRFITLLMTILVLIGTAVLGVFLGMISLNSVPLLLLVNFVSGSRLELMYISLIKSIRSSRTHLHGFQLLALLP